MGTSVAKIKEEVLSDMGGGPDGLLVVELSDTQFAHAIKEAKRWFTARKGFSVWRPVPIAPDQSEYKMKDDVAQVLDVIFEVPSDVSAFFTLGFFDVIPYGPNSMMSMGSGLSNYSGFVQLLQFTEARKRVFSVDPDWYYDQQTKILRAVLRSASTSPSGIMLVQAKLSDFDPVNLNDKDEYIFVKWVKAKCKEIIGRTRSKYDAMPAAGGPVAMDGKSLLEEAKLDFEALDKEIFASQGPDMPVVG